MYRVLIVDDDRAMLYMLKRFGRWAEYGFEIADEASDGREAVRKLAGKQIDLAITDIKMPGMDGIEFLQELKRIKREICVVFLSTHSDFEYAKQGIRLGVFDYMTKPVDETVLAEVLERVRAHLDDKNRRSAKIEEDRRLLEESLHLYYPKDSERKLVSMLVAGNDGLPAEAAAVMRDIAHAAENDAFKTGAVLERILAKLYESIFAVYPWLGKIELPEARDNKKAAGSVEELGTHFLDGVRGILAAVKKYELHQTDSIVRKTCEYVLSHAEEDIKLEDIAREVHVRSDYIGKLFRKKTGCKLNDYITKIKMEHAKSLIMTGGYKNYEISDRLGYSSPDYFCRLFKSYTGCTPSEYKNQRRPGVMQA